ncbi:tRNA uridine-5-carboxymethylaminomethyl(34) synthesis GTPase MnmE [Elusimicrobiota bacterium]
MNLFKQEDTIVALATPKGKSALAIIRISGKNSFDMVSSVFFDRKNNPIKIKNKTVHHGYICTDNKKQLDEVILTYMQSPNSVTGEDVIEISTHGNQIIIQSIIKLLLDKGCRLADKGEFTYRAFINNKIDLTEAEAVNTLIESKTQKSVELSLNSLQGSLSNKIKEIKEELINLFAYLEVSLDYPHEDIDFLSRREKEESLKKIISKTEEVIRSYSVTQALTDGIKIAIIGKPNAGKSSLLNSIVGYQRAIVTDIEGTTTDTIEETVEYKGIPFTIIDTAGIRHHTANMIEKLGQERTGNSIKNADIILWVIDINSKIDDNDATIRNLLNKKLDKTIIVLTKSDLPHKISSDSVKNFCSAKEIILYSCLTDNNIDKILNSVYSAGQFENLETDSTILLNTRQYNLICRFKESLETTFNLTVKGDSDEIVSFETQTALDILNEILGIDIKDDIASTIFSKFCIGK